MPQSKLPSFLLTAWLLLGTIAARTRMGEFLRTLKDYEIVHPRVFSGIEARSKRSILESEKNGKEKPSDLQEFEGEELFVEIGNWTLRTVTNDRLILSSNFAVQWMKDEDERDNRKRRNNRLEEESESYRECKFQRGTLDENWDSLVVLTICNEDIYALMLVKEESFFVQPLTDGQHVMYRSNNVLPWTVRGKDYVSVMLDRFQDAPTTDVPSKYYGNQEENFETVVARGKRECIACYTQEFYNLSGDSFDTDFDLKTSLFYDENEDDDDDEYDDEEDETIDDDDDENDDEKNDETDVERHTATQEFRTEVDVTRKRNKPSKKKTTKESPARWLELGIAADYSVVNFHGSRVQQYVFALLNIVSAIYMDPSLQSSMILVLVRMIFYTEKRDGMVRYGDARRSLENVNKWNRRLLSLSNGSHDVAIWLTRLDIGGPSGYAPVSGVCDPARSCALNKDEGLTSAFIVAHEVAHILGLTHDGDQSTGNACSEEASRGSVMAPMVAATFHQFYWSTCSKKEFHRRIRRWSCLLNRPDGNDVTELNATVGETFTMDEQCRMEFGEGYELCKSFDITEPCSHLWCGNANVSQACKTKKGPPLDGTLCGKTKWCVNGRCESIDRKSFDFKSVLRKARDGSWSTWSSWGKCSRSCGIGVQCRSRKCNKPPPAYGGKYCSGLSNDCKLCELPECIARVDLRAEQCAKLVTVARSEQNGSKRNITWLPFEPEQENLKCRLICTNKDTGEIFYTGKHLIDGTPCSYGTTNICIQGECRRMGCDNVLGSRKTYDVCGTCGGDDSNCDDIVGKFQRKLRRETTRVLVLPRTAYNAILNITLLRGHRTYDEDITIVLGNGRRRGNVQSNFASRKEETLIVEGTAFRVEKFENGTYTLRTNGSAFDDVTVSITLSESLLSKGGALIAVSLRYSMSHDDRNARRRYIWSFGGWTLCSSSCAGGTRRRTILCKDMKNDRIVSRRKCAFEPKPAQPVESCNVFSCEFKWLPGPWEGCSASCGSHGTQRRRLYCVHDSFDENDDFESYRTVSVRPSGCKNNPRPENEKECNRIPCPGRWIFTDWSLCSETDRRRGSIQSRIGRCVPPEEEAFYTCDGPPIRTELRACEGHESSPLKELCWKDKSQFCSLPSLRRYCEIPGFRRKCCRSCETT